MSEGDPDPAQWLQRLGDCVGHDHDSMVSVVDGLLIEIPNLNEHLQQSIANENAADIQRYAHTLKSSLRYISSGVDVELAKKVEDLARDNRCDEAAPLVDQLQIHLDNWQRELKAWFDTQTV